MLGEVGVGGDLDESTLELADRVGDVLGNEVEDRIRDVDGLRLRLPAEDSETGLEIRTLDVGDQTPLKSTAKPVFECGNSIWRAIR